MYFPFFQGTTPLKQAAIHSKLTEALFKSIFPHGQRVQIRTHSDVHVMSQMLIWARDKTPHSLPELLRQGRET